MPTSEPMIINCAKCNTAFTPDVSDFIFYETIGVPPPTWCPECRILRKLLWGYGRPLYRRACHVPGHSEIILSRYHPDAPAVVYDYKYWWSDAWDPMDYGKECDFSKPFLEQLRYLLTVVPMKNLDITNSTGCHYCMLVVDSKDCYMVAGGVMSRDCMYSNTPVLSNECVDTWLVVMSEDLYECFTCTKCFNLSYGVKCIECMNSYFLYDCRNCSDCFGCVNLRNKQYYIFNKPYSKKEYKEKIASYDLGSYTKVEEIKREMQKFFALYPKKYSDIQNSVGCSGDLIENGKNCHDAFQIRGGAEDCRRVYLGGRGMKDSRDTFGGGVKSEYVYESATVLGSRNVYFSQSILNSINVQYSRECYSGSNLFGCVGLRNKNYCILNKQYSKEEYGALVPKIIQHMNVMPYIDLQGIAYRYGEFLPPEFSPLAYNESAAQDYFSSTPEAARALHFVWRDQESKDYAVTKRAEEIPDYIRDIPDTIVNDIIECAHQKICKQECVGAFKVTSSELDFYRRHNFAFPRLCPNCRFYERISVRNPWRLWRRRCQCLSKEALGKWDAYQNSAVHFHNDGQCPNEFDSPYDPARPDLVYCEECYRAEVV